MKTKLTIFHFILLGQLAFAFDIPTASKIYDKLFLAVFQKNTIYVYTKDENYKKVILNSKNLRLADNIDSAEIVIVTTGSELVGKTKNKVCFVDSNDLFQSYENVIGAFYWNKGRPEIIFSKNRLKLANLELSSDLQGYAK